MRPRTLTGLALALAAACPAALAAQRTADQARLVLTVSGGYVGGADLWRVPRQPFAVELQTDTFDLDREIRPTLGVAFSGAYFPGEHVGFIGEAFLIGLGYEDACRLVSPTGNAQNAAACTSIQGRQRAATSVVLSAGAIYRINSRRLLSPYARANAGLVFSNQSPLSMTGVVPTGAGPATAAVYTDDHESRVTPGFALGLGFTAAIGRGYQLRWEVRDNIVGVQAVTGPTEVRGLIPPHRMRYKHLLGFLIGFDVVLERRRGRRY
jgi:hypothetical protein